MAWFNSMIGDFEWDIKRKTIQNQMIIRSYLCERTSSSKTFIYGRIKAGDFPKPVRLGPGSVGWYESEVDEWIATRPRVEPGGGGMDDQPALRSVG